MCLSSNRRTIIYTFASGVRKTEMELWRLEGFKYPLLDDCSMVRKYLTNSRGIVPECGSAFQYHTCFWVNEQKMKRTASRCLRGDLGVKKHLRLPCSRENIGESGNKHVKSSLNFSWGTNLLFYDETDYLLKAASLGTIDWEHTMMSF